MSEQTAAIVYDFDGTVPSLGESRPSAEERKIEIESWHLDPIDRSCLRRAVDQATSCLEPGRPLAMDRKHKPKQQLTRRW